MSWESESSSELSDTTNDTKKNGCTKDGCKHYIRRCLFVSPCCGKIYPCRLCHDEENTHILNRHAVQEIVCALCKTKQNVSNKCTFCEVSFGNYFCSVCRMYDDASKGQYHCEGCGICRVGGKNNFFHCQICGLCLPLSLKETHKCIELNSRQNCPVCMEDIHTSRDPANLFDCGHLMHGQCYKTFLRKGHYQCPICGVSLAKMDEAWKAIDKEIEDTPMPEEYAEMKVWILCKDCHEVSRTQFHVVGLKCAPCGSYNTCGTDAPPSQETEV